MYIIPGGVRADLPAGLCRPGRGSRSKVEKLLVGHRTHALPQRHLQEAGEGPRHHPAGHHRSSGVTGPNARAAGFRPDIRKDQPYLVYDRLDFEMVTGTDSDAYARAWVRLQEMYQSIALIRQILERMPEGPFHTKLPNVLHWKIPAGRPTGRANAPGASTATIFVTDGRGYPRRYCAGPLLHPRDRCIEHLAIGVDYCRSRGTDGESPHLSARDRTVKNGGIQHDLKDLSPPSRSGSGLWKNPIPFVSPRRAAGSRALPGFHKNDVETCIGCGTCESICQNEALDLVAVRKRKNGDSGLRPKIDYGRCCWCALCVDICTTGIAFHE